MRIFKTKTNVYIFKHKKILKSIAILFIVNIKKSSHVRLCEVKLSFEVCRKFKYSVVIRIKANIVSLCFVNHENPRKVLLFEKLGFGFFIIIIISFGFFGVD